MDEKRLEELEKIVSGKSFEELSESDMEQIAGAVSEMGDVNPESLAEVVTISVAACVSALAGLISYKKGCL